MPLLTWHPNSSMKENRRAGEKVEVQKVKALFPEVGEWVLAQGLSVSAASAYHLSSRFGGKAIATSSRRLD